MEELSASPLVWRVFVDGRGHDVPLGSSALSAIRHISPALGDEVEAGTRRITDSRGLDVAGDAPAHGGAVYRVLRVRGAEASSAEDT
jgi:hypothetical protein